MSDQFIINSSKKTYATSIINRSLQITFSYKTSVISSELAHPSGYRWRISVACATGPVCWTIHRATTVVTAPQESRSSCLNHVFAEPSSTSPLMI